MLRRGGEKSSDEFFWKTCDSCHVNTDVRVGKTGFMCAIPHLRPPMVVGFMTLLALEAAPLGPVSRVTESAVTRPEMPSAENLLSVTNFYGRKINSGSFLKAWKLLRDFSHLFLISCHSEIFYISRINFLLHF